MTAGDQLDGICNHLPTDEGRFHAFRAHGNAVGYSDGIVLNRGAAGRSDPGLHPFGQAAKVIVARHDFDPGIGDADQGAFKVGIREADRFQHGASGARPGPSSNLWLLCRGSIVMETP